MFYVRFDCCEFWSWCDLCQIYDDNYLSCYAQWTMLQYFSRYSFCLYLYLGKWNWNCRSKSIYKYICHYMCYEWLIEWAEWMKRWMNESRMNRCTSEVLCYHCYFLKKSLRCAFCMLNGEKEKKNPQLAKFQAKHREMPGYKSVFSLVEMRSAIISGWENNLVTKVVKRCVCDVERTTYC